MSVGPRDDSVGARLLRGDEQAWAVVLAEIMPRAEAAIRRRFGPDWGYLGAEDVVHSALGSIVRGLKLSDLVDRLDSWDYLQGLLVVVASRKLIDDLRKAGADKDREIRYQKDSQLIKRFYDEDAEREMDMRLEQLSDALRNETERIVFEGKYGDLTEEQIAREVEARTGERMTRYMVRETWRALRARFHRISPELLEPS